MSEDNPYAPPEYPPPAGPSFAPSAGDSWAPPEEGGSEPGDAVTRPVAGVATQPVTAVRQTNSSARLALILGALSLLLTPLAGIAAVIVGRRARAEIARSGEGGEGLAKVGIWMGAGFSLAWLLGAAFLIAVHLGSIAS